jgi:SOS response regulatory protein OraA/RecX
VEKVLVRVNRIKSLLAKARRENAPAADGDQASPVKTGKSAKSSKQAAKSDKAQCALQLFEKGFTPEQITAMLRN